MLSLADDGKKYILRLFNPSGLDQSVKVNTGYGCGILRDCKAHEFATYGIDKSGISEF